LEFLPDEPEIERGVVRNDSFCASDEASNLACALSEKLLSPQFGITVAMDSSRARMTRAARVEDEVHQLDIKLVADEPFAI
jgi:hypothetical protein